MVLLCLVFLVRIFNVLARLSGKIGPKYVHVHVWVLDRIMLLQYNRCVHNLNTIPGSHHELINTYRFWQARFWMVE